MKQKKTKAQKRAVAAKWHEGLFVLEEAEHAAIEHSVKVMGISDSVIFDKNQVRLVYKDIRTSLVATIIVGCLLAGAYAMMRF